MGAVFYLLKKCATLGCFSVVAERGICPLASHSVGRREIPPLASHSRLTSTIIVSKDSLLGLLRFVKASHRDVFARSPGTDSSSKRVRMPRSEQHKQKQHRYCGAAFVCGGERGIRTLGTVLAFTRFPIVRLRPAQPSLHLLDFYIIS